MQEEHNPEHGCNFGDLGLQSSRWGQGPLWRELSDFWAIEQDIVVGIVACCWRRPEALALHCWDSKTTLTTQTSVVYRPKVLGPQPSGKQHRHMNAVGLQ